MSSDYAVLSILKQGYTGVSFFCVISGFILTVIYFDQEFKIRNFIKNRVLRIAPLFIFFLFLSYYTSAWDLSALIATTITGLSRGGLPSYVGPGWTVLIEFQFYLLFPFLVIFTKKYGIKYILGLVFLFLLIRFAVWSAAGTVQLVSYYSIFGRMDQFLAGMLAARALSSLPVQNFFSRRYFCFAVLVGGLILAFVFFGWVDSKGGLLNFEGSPWPSISPWWALIPTIEGLIYAVLLCSYLSIPCFKFTGVLSKIFSYVGLVSYSIYLNHLLFFPSIISLIDKIGVVPASWEQSLVVTLFIAMPCLVVVSSITYFTIELPFMKLRGRVNQGRVRSTETAQGREKLDGDRFLRIDAVNAAPVPASSISPDTGSRIQ